MNRFSERFTASKQSCSIYRVTQKKIEMTFNDEISEPDRSPGASANSLGIPQQATRHRRPSWARPMTPQTRRILREEDEEWSTPVAKILQLYYDHESWQQAQEILEGPGPICRKIGDEARSLAARHIIDRLKERNLLNKIHKVAPRLRSAVELLSKPDADYVYPHFQYVVNEMREKYPDVYTSVIQNVRIRIPSEMKPSHMLVSLAKSTVEDHFGEIRMNWGKFVALLGLCGALAVDSVEAGYPDGVAEIVETFGIIVEQVMGDWILTDKPYGGGGWQGFIDLNVYRARIPKMQRTFLIIFIFLLILYILYYFIVTVLTFLLQKDEFWRKWYTVSPEVGFCYTEAFPNLSRTFIRLRGQCPKPKSPLEYLYARRIHRDNYNFLIT